MQVEEELLEKVKPQEDLEDQVVVAMEELEGLEQVVMQLLTPEAVAVVVGIIQTTA